MVRVRPGLTLRVSGLRDLLFVVLTQRVQYLRSLVPNTVRVWFLNPKPEICWLLGPSGSESKYHCGENFGLL